MKRSVIPVLGLVAGITLAASHPAARPAAGAIPRVRSESANGNVVLRGLNDDEKARQERRSRVRDQEAGTYIPEILLARDSALTRWHDRPTRPVTVWVQSRPDLSDWTDEYVTAVSTAFMDWDSVELPIRFRMVTDSAAAEVHVTWIDRFSEPISGRTRWTRDDSWWIVNANIQLAVHHQKGDCLDGSAMKAMALHEVGHLLGLDHTSDVGSIMAPKVRIRELAGVDVATVRLLYAVPAGSLR
jgi:hypothetical protein